MIKQSIKKVLLIGSGGLRISQAGEFDYSGSQAIKALKEEGIEVILVNPNIATVQTDDSMADQVYLQPLNIESVSAIIAKERPDAVLLSFGGQTALNLGLALEEEGVFARYNVEVLGTAVETIRLAEDRKLFKAALQKINVDVAQSICAFTLEEAIAAGGTIGYPLMIRTGFSLGGLGSGIIHNEQELVQRAQQALSGSPQVLVEECLLGWGEFEYEIVRDGAGNTITVCNMENFDPMGIHTGESIVVAPSQTLDNDEYHLLRQIALKVANHFNIIGECNIQYAYNQQSGEYRVIEINPRLSRSSALASKATGYPLAFVAAKLALGYRLHQIKNSVTEKTCAFFEPALDYLVVKIPRWDIHKLKAAERYIGTEMKSVGEVMAIGRSFPEALQKAIGMLNIGADDLTTYPYTLEQPLDEIQRATDRRLFALYQYFVGGGSVEQAQQLAKIHPWFLHHLITIANFQRQLSEQPPLTATLLRQAKQLGFSDVGIARLSNQTPQAIRQQRLAHNISPYVKQIDTLAGETEAQTNYLYLTYHAQQHDLKPSTKKAVLVLGSGPYSIGSSVEFDWCAVNTARTLRKLGYQTLMINSNPETVSTDYDESDRLYFEQLSFERVCDIATFENLEGIVVSVGGQIANNLALPLSEAGFPILGTSPHDIERAENRAEFSALLQQLAIDQPEWMSVVNIDQAEAFVRRVGFPVLIRPSFVLSGAAMNVVNDKSEMARYLQEATCVSPNYPVVISKFISDAKELEIDGVARDGEIVIEAISEHIENAGVHSGDATIVLPPQKLYLETIRRAKKIVRQIVKALSISGPFNAQLIAKENALKVIECNVRASRSLPFASKVTGYNFIDIATRVLMGCYKKERYQTLELDHVGVKTPLFSYQRLKGANPVAHVEMASTGEVACLGQDLLDAFYRSWQATELSVAKKRLFVSVSGEQRNKLVDYLAKLEAMGWDIYATCNTHDFLARHGIGSYFVYKISDQAEPSAATLIVERKVNLIINIPASRAHLDEKQGGDEFKLRRLAIDHHIPLITNLHTAQVMLQALIALYEAPVSITSWQEFMSKRLEKEG
ncbi:MAG: carbamoyl-phosphate synthase (glutamine-hydrolyzing) large subunit [Gammaproteobacteria bacterium]|nr:carbamoyl-phosphate synthase (glutamine-hydrolyzing) large subunit [Gammaproteobacteria bacterium]